MIVNYQLQNWVFGVPGVRHQMEMNRAESLSPQRRQPPASRELAAGAGICGLPGMENQRKERLVGTRTKGRKKTRDQSRL
jgi:hypothetical protein